MATALGAGNVLIRRWRALVMVAALLVPLTAMAFEIGDDFPGDTFPPGTCIGDCDGDGAVHVAELVTGIRVLLGDALLSACAAIECPDGPGEGVGVFINCTVQAVNNALDGCSAPPQ